MIAQPLRDHIVVLQDPIRQDVSSVGLVIPASKGIVQSQTQLGRTGIVIACGPDIDADQLKPGDRIAYGEFMYPEIHDGAKTYLVLRDKDVCGVCEDDAEHGNLRAKYGLTGPDPQPLEFA